MALPSDETLRELSAPTHVHVLSGEPIALMLGVKRIVSPVYAWIWSDWPAAADALVPALLAVAVTLNEEIALPSDVPPLLTGVTSTVSGAPGAAWLLTLLVAELAATETPAFAVAADARGEAAAVREERNQSSSEEIVT